MDEALMPLNRFQKLKNRLKNEKELSNVWLYYSDNFLRDPSFTDMGDRTHNDFIEAVIPQICAQMFGKKDKPQDLFQIEIPEHNFIHGAFQVGGRLSQFIYFKSSQLGMIIVANRLDEERMVNYARFGNPLASRAPANLDLN
ncbi:MAG: hypothetical protein AAGJ95_13625 [Cyanobacteria bacterium J06554_11]